MLSSFRRLSAPAWIVSGVELRWVGARAELRRVQPHDQLFRRVGHFVRLSSYPRQTAIGDRCRVGKISTPAPNVDQFTGDWLSRSGSATYQLEG